MNYVRASQRRRKRQFILYIIFLLIWSISILFMPFVSAYKEAIKILPFVPGGGFWIGLIGTITMVVKINRIRRRSCRSREKFPKWKQLGLVNFFKNKEAVVADVGMFISIIGFIFVRIFTNNIYCLFVFLALFVFTFGMHCMLNGITYKYINYGKYVKEQKKDE